MNNYKLEKIEWTQVWSEDADCPEKPRILLIGDSISVGYRSGVYHALEKKWGVTTFSTSKAIDNPFLLEEILLLGKQMNFQFDYVHFNNGLHGLDMPDELYEKYYRQVLEGILEHFTSAKVSVATSTSMCKKENDNMELSDRNDIVLRRNETVKKVAKEKNLEVDDLYEVSVRDLNYHCDDCVHYTGEGYEILAKHVAEFLMK